MKFLATVLLFAILTACAPQATAMPTPLPSATQMPTATVTLLPTPTITQTQEPTATATVTLEPTPVFVFDLSKTPDSIDDIAGEIRVENLSADLSILAEKMIAQAKEHGIKLENVGELSLGGDLIAHVTPGMGFLPWEYVTQIIYRNNTNQEGLNKSRHAVLTKLVDETGLAKGYGFSLLVKPAFGSVYISEEVKVAHFVLDDDLFNKLEELRLSSGIGYQPRPNLVETMKLELLDFSKVEKNKWVDSGAFLSVGKLSPNSNSYINEYDGDHRLVLESDQSNPVLVGNEASAAYFKGFSERLNNGYFVVAAVDFHTLSP